MPGHVRVQIGSGARWLRWPVTERGHSAGGNLGLIVYGYVNGTLQTVYSNVIGVKPDGLAFLTGDFLGFGSTQIAQLRDHNGTLELLIYGSTEGTPQLQTDLDMDQGPAALAFLAGNFTGSGNDEIAQLWDDNGNLGLIVYGNVNGTPQTVYSDTDLFEGSGALAFLTGDFTGRPASANRPGHRAGADLLAGWGGPVLLLPQGGPVHRAGHHRLVFGPQRPARAPVPAGTAGAALGGL